MSKSTNHKSITHKCLAVIAALCGCMVVLLLSSPPEGGGTEGASGISEASPTVEEIVNEVRGMDRLYVAEYVVHKLVTADDIRTLELHWMGMDMKIPAALGDRKIAIPMEAVLKAYVDFDSLTADDIVIGDAPRTLTVTLRQPAVELTASKINHAEIREYTSFTRMKFSDEEMASLEKQGREVILRAIPDMGITGRARKNAQCLLKPILMKLGFEKVTVEFKGEGVRQ